MTRWHKEDIRLLDEFLESGKSIDFISAHFQTTPENIRMVMSRQGLRVKKSEAGRASPAHAP